MYSQPLEALGSHRYFIYYIQSSRCLIQKIKACLGMLMDTRTQLYMLADQFGK